MDRIKFGNDGWRGIIAKDFTLANVSKFAYAVARWSTSRSKESSVVIGYDCRFGGEMFMEACAKILASKGIRVYIPENFVSSAMVSLGVVKLKANCGIMITAGHKPAKFNGIKLKGSYGGPLLWKDINDIENLISDDYELDLEMLNWNYLIERGMIQYINLESIYLKEITDNFDLEKFTNNSIRFGFDAMYGSTQNIFKKIMPGIKMYHCERNPSFGDITPDPLHNNLHELAENIWKHKDIDCALAVNSDGDRLAMYDGQGNYIDSQRILLLLIHYLVKYKEQSGKVIASFACSQKVEYLCSHYGIELIHTKSGFSHISEIMLKEDILIGGDETGGLSLGTYLPERDGIWIGITIWNWLIECGKTLSELICEIEEITGPFVFDKIDININKNLRKKILEKCQKRQFTEFGDNLVTKVEDLDGYKFYFGKDEWILLKPLILQPAIRVYVEAGSKERVYTLISTVKSTLLHIN